MCSEPISPMLSPMVEPAAPLPSSRALPASAAGASIGSRRRRLWELPAHAHCPVIGLCLPLTTLRRLVDKVVGGAVMADDYELHSGAVADIRVRTRTAEALQRELDRRHAGFLRLAAAVKDRQALLCWWRDASRGANLPGALWATLTHPRCDLGLEDQILREAHMLQHQLGAAERVDMQRLQSLAHENAVLARQLASAQQRCTHLTQEQARKVDQLQAQLVQLRAELIRRDTQVSQAREALAELEQAVPHLRQRQALTRQHKVDLERIRSLERTLASERERVQRDVARSAAETMPRADVGPAQTAVQAPIALDRRAVLCVGGRQGSVPAYRALIEEAGGRFLHHDGGEEDNVAQLDATLAAADLVICQVGCISHDAYWRVKDHCKRSDKRCVFVEQPSRSGLQRALNEQNIGL